MTKKQFLKKSKKTLKEIGIELLIIREIPTQEKYNSVDLEKTYLKMEKIRKNLENIFFKYEKLNPPSKCKNLQINLLKTIIILQEAVVAIIEHLNLLKDGSNEQSKEKLIKSKEKLDKFRENYGNLSREVDLYLK
ncbi:MAG: hypothetical protein QM396_02670 [Euryarchaeota archaeon]|uniref:hypothetical protein n=1 Tax=Methanobacterium sp. MZD130B TaxID=3394378 RepID=UPI0039FCCD30|nr:hypothetical protein [Euryarchaeota archaeon]